MNKSLKKTLSIILTILMIVTSVPFAFAADLYGGGWCGANGNNLIWKVYSDGTLEISGTGKMADYEEVNTAPWYTQYGDFITCVAVEDGAENIGERAFKDLVNLTSISIPASVTSIEAYAFKNCSALTEINYHGNEDEILIDKTGNKILINVLNHWGTNHTFNVGDITQWGAYPQSKVNDETLTAILDEMAPEWDEWISYGYYSGENSISGSMKPGDWMRYIDITYDGEKYRGVRFTHYRPKYTLESLGTYSSYQDNNGYYTNTNYWFRFEPINWRVLDPDTGLVICETIIDSQPFSNTLYGRQQNSQVINMSYYNDASCTILACDYETSSIRKWLNDDFYNTAFSEAEKEGISTATVNNNVYYKSDKIFLLSYDESINSAYGFDSSQSKCDKARRIYGSEYAKAQGLEVSDADFTGYSSWILRTGGGYRFFDKVRHDGMSISVSDYVEDTSDGVRPALTLTLNLLHNIVKYEAKEPTCTEIGWDEYSTCKADGCEYTTYAEIPAMGHDWSNKDGICDNCEYVCPHEWNDGVLTRPERLTTTEWDDGYYTYTCALCGTYYHEAVKRADYTAFEAVMTDYIDIVNNKSVFDSVKDELSSIYQQNTDVTGGNRIETEQAEVDAVVKLLSDKIDVIKPGIEDGTAVKADYTKIDGTFAGIDEALENATISEEMANELSDIKAQLEVLRADENTSAADLINSGLLDRAEAVADTMADCAKGIHTFSKYEVTEEAGCGVAGKEAAVCDNGCGATDENELPALEHNPTSHDCRGYYCSVCREFYGEPADHKDEDSDYLCDHGCGYEFDKNEDPSDTCDHICHSSNALMKLLWKIISFFLRLFDIQRYCDCGVLHYDAPIFG